MLCISDSTLAHSGGLFFLPVRFPSATGDLMAV